MKLFSAVILVGLVSGTAHAGQVFDGSGAGTGQSMNEVFVLGDGHMVMHSVGTYAPLATADPASPMSAMTGSCFGSIEIKGASASGSGHCNFGKTGSAIVTDWNVTGITQTGALTGTWNVIGASGSAAGLTGGGAFSNLTNRETGAFENTISGALIMP